MKPTQTNPYFAAQWKATYKAHTTIAACAASRRSPIIRRMPPNNRQRRFQLWNRPPNPALFHRLDPRCVMICQVGLTLPVMIVRGILLNPIRIDARCLGISIKIWVILRNERAVDVVGVIILPLGMCIYIVAGDLLYIGQ